MCFVLWVLIEMEIWLVFFGEIVGFLNYGCGGGVDENFCMWTLGCSIEEEFGSCDIDRMEVCGLGSISGCDRGCAVEYHGGFDFGDDG